MVLDLLIVQILTDAVMCKNHRLIEQGLTRDEVMQATAFIQHTTGLIPRTLGPCNVFILLNGWICLHGVLD